MDPSPEFATGGEVADAFVSRLRCLTNEEFAALVQRIGRT
jgi:hypothetical protein